MSLYTLDDSNDRVCVANSLWSVCLMGLLLVALPGCDSGETNLPPSTDFSFEPSNPRAGTSVQFTANPSDPENNIQDLLWTFRGEVEGYPKDTSGKTPTHTFPRKGTYEVKLTVRDDIGSTAEADSTIDVRQRFNQVAIRDTVQVARLPYSTAEDGENPADDDQDWVQDDEDSDLYYRLSDGTGTLYESESHTDFVPDDLPVTFENIDYSTSDLSSTYSFSLYDADGSSPDDLIRTIGFSFEDNVACNVNAASCYPDIKRLLTPPGANPDNADTIVYLHLDWEE